MKQFAHTMKFNSFNAKFHSIKGEKKANEMERKAIYSQKTKEEVNHYGSYN